MQCFIRKRIDYGRSPTMRTILRKMEYHSASVSPQLVSQLVISPLKFLVTGKLPTQLIFGLLAASSMSWSLVKKRLAACEICKLTAIKEGHYLVFPDQTASP